MPVFLVLVPVAVVVAACPCLKLFLNVPQRKVSSGIAGILTNLQRAQAKLAVNCCCPLSAMIVEKLLQLTVAMGF